MEKLDVNEMELLDSEIGIKEELDDLPTHMYQLDSISKEADKKYVKCADVFVDCSGNVLFKCIICGAKLQHSRTYIIHLESHFSNEDHPCQHCNISFSDLNTLLQHVTSTHADNSIYTFKNDTESECNSVQESADQGMQSDIETIATEETIEIKIEELSQTTSSECEELTPEKATVAKASSLKKGSKEKADIVCTTCGLVLKHSVSLNRHMRIHNEERPYKCNFCEKSFISNSALRIHMRTHTGEKPYMCSVCGATFCSGNQLNMHMKKHAGIKQHKCNQPGCKKEFYTQHQLKDHIRVHTGERPFSCLVCGKSFRAPNALRQHSRLHSDEKRYVCPICNAAFAQAAGLHGHKKNHHHL